jgi:hypothetical protein
MSTFPRKNWVPEWCKFKKIAPEWCKFKNNAEFKVV